MAVSFFVGAHPDDWQIFAGGIARDDIKSAKVVFVYLTAGDDHRTDGWWEAREAGAIASTVLLSSFPAGEEEVLQFGDRPIARRKIGNTISYFLRIPDGHLTELKAGKAKLITVDKSAEYPDWDSLVSVVGSILDHESGSNLADNPWINTSDYQANPAGSDHLDHTATGDVIRLIAPNKYRVLYWAGYKDIRRKQEVTYEDFSCKVSLMLEYSKVVKANYKKSGDYEECYIWYNDLMCFSHMRTEPA